MKCLYFPFAVGLFRNNIIAAVGKKITSFIKSHSVHVDVISNSKCGRQNEFNKFVKNSRVRGAFIKMCSWCVFVTFIFRQYGLQVNFNEDVVRVKSGSVARTRRIDRKFLRR